MTDLGLADNPLQMHWKNSQYLIKLVNEARARLYGGYVYEDEGNQSGTDYHIDGAKAGLITYREIKAYHDVFVGEDGYYTYNFWNVPDYLVDEENKTFKTIKVEDVIDMEYFLETEVRQYADQLAKTHTIEGYWNVRYPEYEYGYSIDVVIGAPEDYPLSLPTYESYAAALAEYESVDEYLRAYHEAFRLECIAADGYANFDYWYSAGTPFMSIVDYNDRIEANNISIANADVAAEFVKTIEAAKAEFETYVAEFEAEIDAIRPVVEESWAGIYEKLAEIEKAKEAIEARYDEIFDLALFIFTLMEDYTGEYDIDVYVAALEQAYADAVEAVTFAEFDLEDAQADLETVMAGGEDAITEVEMAQKAYDKVAAELAEALAELEAAAEALDAAMVAVGAAEPEETPAE